MHRMDSDNTLVNNLIGCHYSAKWTPLVVYLLRNGQPQRYSQLKRQINGISQKMLTQTLRQLEKKGIVSRTVYPTVPSTVEYALTEKGKTLIEPFHKIIEQAANQGNLDPDQ